MPLDDFLSSYNKTRERIEAQPMRELQQVGALQGILANVQKQKMQQQALAKQQQYEQAMKGAKTDEERMAIAQQQATPDAVLRTGAASLDRQNALKMKAAELVQAHQFKLDEIKQRSTDAAATARELLGEKQRFERSMKEFMVANRPAPQPRVEQPPVAVIGPDGKPVFVNRADAIGKAPAVKETADRVIPANIAKAYTENSTALRKIDSALSEVDNYPEAFGLQNIRGDAISQRMDPKGVTARAIVADIGSLKIHDRSGAAVTAAETPRLLPFIPNVNDKPETVKKKLALFRKEYEAIQNDIGSMYSAEQGYRALPSAQSRSSDKTRMKFDAQGNPVP